MSVRVMDWVWKHSRCAKASDKVVLLAIADHADHHGGDAYPGVEELVRYARLSERQVYRSLRALEKLGEIAVDVPGGGRGRRTTYRVVMRNDDETAGLRAANGATRSPLATTETLPHRRRNPATQAQNPATQSVPIGEPSRTVLEPSAYGGAPDGTRAPTHRVIDAAPVPEPAPEPEPARPVLAIVDDAAGTPAAAAQALVDAHVHACAPAVVSPDVQGRLRARVTGLLLAGVTAPVLTAALARLRHKALGVHLLDELVLEVQLEQQPGTGSTSTAGTGLPPPRCDHGRSRHGCDQCNPPAQSDPARVDAELARFYAEQGWSRGDERAPAPTAHGPPEVREATG